MTESQSEPTRAIVSNQVDTVGGGITRLEQDLRDDALYLTCTGCRTNKDIGGMAPALAELVRHAGNCTVDPNTEKPDA